MEAGEPMTKPAWKIDQPPVAEMMFPVRCMHCSRTYDIGRVHVTARFADCSVWTSPCCGHPGIDDRPWVRDRHYREVDKRTERGLPPLDEFGRRWVTP